MVIVFQQLEESELREKPNQQQRTERSIERREKKLFRRINWMKDESVEND